MRLEIAGTRTSPARTQIQDEATLTERGVYLPHGKSAWQVGELCLAGDRLRFLQPRGAILDISLTWVIALSVEQKHFIVLHKPAMSICYHDPQRQNPQKAWFITPFLGQWLVQLTALITGGERGVDKEDGQQRMDLKGDHAGVEQLAGPDGAQEIQEETITQEDLRRLARELDPVSQEILSHLWLNGHADINELTELVAASTHMDILFRIRRGINPLAQRMLGRPILVFEESRFDVETGEMVPFSWWLAGRTALHVCRPDPRTEVLDEGDEINVFMELPGVDEETIRYKSEQRKLVVWVDGAEAASRQEVVLPVPVAAEQVTARFNNSILVINLKKAG